jgi:hypothetical protein
MQRVDLKSLVQLIKDNKDFEANLILDEGCTIETDDPKPLVKVLNYLINYLKELSDRPIEISLDLRPQDYLLSMLIYTDKSDLPDLSDQISDILNQYKASLEKIHNTGNNFQLKIAFSR